MAPPSKGKSAANSPSSADHIRAFNVAVAEYRQQVAINSNSSTRALAELEKIVPVLAKISDASGISTGHCGQHSEVGGSGFRVI